MSTAVTPQMPVENWQQIRDEWIAEVGKMAGDVEQWAKENDWDTKREMKEIAEEVEIGPYEVPTVRIQTMQGRLYFEPIGRLLIGAAGRIEITATPSFYQLIMLKIDGVWRFMTESNLEDLHKPWSREGFTEVVANLLKKR